MPLIFATGAPTASGHAYEDIYGVQYEFPTQYSGMVVEGERFVYYRGRRGAVRGGGSVYLGDGIVGKSRASRNPGKRVVSLHDVTTFAEPLSFKAPDGTYWETGSTSASNWTSGVRRTTDEVFERIIEAGMGVVADADSAGASGFHADPEHASAMERYSVEVAMKLLAAEFGSDYVHEMPAGNPGFDIEVTVDPPLHIEVKGTVLAEAAFHLSEGQRRHAELLGDRFRLIVVHAIDTRRRVHEVTTCKGGQLDSWANLQPAAWSGVLVEPDAER